MYSIVDEDLKICFPVKKLTIFYGALRTSSFMHESIKCYHFHLSVDEIFSIFDKVQDKQPVLHTISKLLGLSNLVYDEKNKMFSDTSIRFSSKVWYNIENINGGLRQLIGLISLLLNSEQFGNNGVIYIDYPEASLHGKVQSAIGKFLAKMYLKSINGIGNNDVISSQIILNTTSEHLINGLRVGILDHNKSREDVVINFAMDMQYPCSIFLNEKNTHSNIDFTMYPDGFMDKASIDLAELLGF